MDQYTMMDILGKAFADGEIDALRPLMAADCDYASQYANKSLSGVSKICLLYTSRATAIKVRGMPKNWLPVYLLSLPVVSYPRMIRMP